MLNTDKLRYERLDEWIAERKRTRYYFNVEPRYTPGSPAMISEHLAMRLAGSELTAFNLAKDGRYGDDKAKKARELGPSNIVFVMRELPRGKGWDVLDLVTGERSTRPFAERAHRYGR